MSKNKKSQPKRSNWLVWMLLIVSVFVLVSRVFKHRSFSESKTIDGLEIPKLRPGETIITHSGFSLSYSEEHEQPYWVAYQLTVQEASQKNAKRENNFRPDPKVPTGSATPDDYKGSGYDRGHLAPAADMAFSPQAMSESFFMSNVSPQAPEFNRGIWNELEQKIRQWAKSEGGLYIVTAGVLENKLPKIGSNGVSVPQYYYKVLLDFDAQPKAIGFLLKNEGSKKPLRSFVVSVDSIERLTGIDFFHKLEDELEQKLESESNASQWGF